jgi:hypothetical protein
MILITWLTISSSTPSDSKKALAVWPDNFVSVIEFAIRYIMKQRANLQLFHYKLRALQSIMHFL